MEPQLPPPPLVLERRVEFSQTDAAGIMHFTTWFIFMEAAEAELFRRIGHPLIRHEDRRGFGFPRVDCQCRFKRPVAFDDLIRINLWIDSLEAGRIRYRFRFTNSSGKTCAEGTLVTASAIREADGTLKGAPLPESLREALERWKNAAS